ncbi:MAG: LamG domain-containing protein [Patescibacteria group bacterium]
MKQGLVRFCAVLLICWLSVVPLATHASFISFVKSFFNIGSSLNSGLVGYWTFDGKNMTPKVMDSSGQENTGVLAGFTSTTTGVGRIGQALIFDGSDDKVTVGSSPLLTTTTFSLSAWIKLNNEALSIEREYIVFSQYNAGTGRTIFSADSRAANGNDAARFFIGGAGGIDVTTTTKVPENVWTHISVVSNAGVTQTYFNGVADGTGATATIIPESTGVQLGGNSLLSTSYFPGVIDDMRVYNRALSVAEINRLYTLGAGSKVGVVPQSGGSLAASLQSSLVGHWTFDGKNMTPKVMDSSGNSNNGTLASFTSTTTAIGRIGQGLNFDGVNDHVTVPYVAGLAPTAAVSFGTWVKFSDKTALNQKLFSKTESGGYQMSLNENSTCAASTLCAVVFVGGAYRTVTYAASNLSNNTWYHVFATYNGSTFVLYLNGVAVDTNSSFSGVVSYANSNTLCIGREAGAATCASDGSLLSGTLDDARVYSRGLRAEEVKRLYSFGAQ